MGAGGTAYAEGTVHDNGFDCGATTIAMAMSPNDDKRAVVQERVCSSPGIATTGVDDIVEILDRDEAPTVGYPRSPHDVLLIDEHGSWHERPILRWLSPDALQVTIDNKALIGFREVSYRGVTVTIKFEPDDPVERARMLKELGLRPDSD